MYAGTLFQADDKSEGAPMALSMYELTVPTLLRGFGVLSSYLEKVEELARAKAIDPGELIQARLAPDMLTFAGQIQSASDKARRGAPSS
jgi:hypothetical protein